MKDIISLVIGIIGLTIAGLVYLQNRKMSKQIQESMGTYRTSNKNVGQLLEEYKKFKIAFDFAYDAIVISDPDGIVLYCNDSVTRVTGFATADIIGKKAGSLWGGQMPKVYYEKLWKTIKEEKLPYFGTIKNRKKNGKTYRAAVSIAPILSHDQNEVQYFVAVERDLDEQL